MKQFHNASKRLSLLALCTALALMLSYVELLIPPLFPTIPGIKMGLANIVTIFLLYRFRLRYAIGVSFTRICLSALLFGNAVSLAYSLAGGFCSLMIMSVLKKLKLFSCLGISVSGAVTHNLGQVLMAMLLLSTPKIAYYAAILVFSGTICGIFIGLCASFFIARIPQIGGEIT